MTSKESNSQTVRKDYFHIFHDENLEIRTS